MSAGSKYAALASLPSTRWRARCPGCGFSKTFDERADAVARQRRNACTECDRMLGVSPVRVATDGGQDVTDTDSCQNCGGELVDSLTPGKNRKRCQDCGWGWTGHVATDGGADPWCDWCQREFNPDGPDWKVETGVVTGLFCSKDCADQWSDPNDTPERVGDTEIRADGGVRTSDADLAAHNHANDLEAALDYVMEAARRARAGTVADGSVARLQLAECGARLAFYATSDEERAVALHDATEHLETAVEAIDDQSVAHPARHALQLFAGQQDGDSQ